MSVNEFGESNSTMPYKVSYVPNDSESLSEYRYRIVAIEGSPRTHVANKRVACEPFPTNVVEKELKNGIVQAKQKGATVQLKVVFRSGDIWPGFLVHLKAELFQSVWAKEIFEAHETKFILVPEEYILLIDPRFPPDNLK
jgi:hypothetical protein